MYDIDEYHVNSINKDKRLLYTSFAISFAFVALIWIIWLTDFLFSLNLAQFGVQPRSLVGLRGILFMPFIHGNFSHLLSNTLPSLILGTVLYNIYPRVAFKTILFVQFFSGILVWLIGAAYSYHIGASAVIFGIASFLFFSGFFRKDRQSIAISFFVGLLYGGSMLIGMMPVQPGVSWEGHLSGAIAGFLCAIYFKNVDLPTQDDENAEFSDDDDGHFFDINPDKQQNEIGL